MTYRKIDTQTWSDSSFLELSAEGKLAYIYLITAPQGDLSGCVECSPGCLARDTGLSREQAQEALSELEREGLVMIDRDTNEVLVKKFGSHQWSKSPKAITATQRAIDKIVSSPLREDAQRRFSAFSGIEYRYPIDTVPIQYPYSTDTVSDEFSAKESAGHIEYPYSIDTVSGTGTGNNPIPEPVDPPTLLQPERARAGSDPAFETPTLEEVRSYAKRMGLVVDVDAFFETNERRGWKDRDGKRIRDWRAFLKSWAESERKRERDARRAHGAARHLYRDESGPIYTRLPHCPKCGSLMSSRSDGGYGCLRCAQVIDADGREVLAS